MLVPFHSRRSPGIPRRCPNTRHRAGKARRIAGEVHGKNEELACCERVAPDRQSQMISQSNSARGNLVWWRIVAAPNGEELEGELERDDAVHVTASSNGRRRRPEDR